MNQPDLETRLRIAFENYHDTSIGVPDDAVLAAGRSRRRHHRIRQAVAAVAAVLVLLGGITVAAVPDRGSLLSPVASWVRGAISHPWMDANGQRFVVTTAPAPPGEVTFEIGRLNPDGSTHNLFGVPTSPDSLPDVGMGTSQIPGVVFSIFPAGAHDISAHTPGDRYRYTVSSMRVTDTANNLEYVAAAISASKEAVNQIDGYTWTDAHGATRSYGF